jgi:hypothetical protein
MIPWEVIRFERGWKGGGGGEGDTFSDLPFSVANKILRMKVKKVPRLSRI